MTRRVTATPAGQTGTVPRIGLVLGAGGVTGDAFHRGVLHALRDAGYDARDADVVVGTSAGAMVGAFLRKPDRPLEEQIEDTVHGEKLGRAPDISPLLSTLRRPWRARAGVIATSLLPTGRASTEFIAAGVRRHHGSDWPTRPLYICAVRRRDGRRVVFGRDGAPETDLPRAVAASCAIPGYFHPVEIGDEVYVDGGVHSPTNADVLRGRDLDVVLVSSPMSVDVHGLRPTIDVGLRLLAHRYLRSEVGLLRRRGIRVVTFEPGGSLLSTMGLNALSGARIEEVEHSSRQRAARLLDSAPEVVELLQSAGTGVADVAADGAVAG